MATSSFVHGGTTNQPYITSGGGKFIDAFTYADLNATAPIDPVTGHRLYKITTISMTAGGTGSAHAGLWLSPGVRYDIATLTLNGVSASVSSTTGTETVTLNSIVASGTTYYAGMYAATSLAVKKDALTGSFNAYLGSSLATSPTAYSGNLYFTVNFYTLPTAPTIGTVTNTSPTSQTVTWTAPSSAGGDVISGYKIDVSSSPNNGATWNAWNTVIETTGTTATSYTVTGLQAGAMYRYRVAAKNAVTVAYNDTNGNPITDGTSSSPFSATSSSLRTKGGVYNASLGYFVPITGAYVQRGAFAWSSWIQGAFSGQLMITFNVTSQPDIKVNDLITIAGTGGYNGDWTVAALGGSTGAWYVYINVAYNATSNTISGSSGSVTSTWRPASIKVYNAGWQTFI